jgi:hypothetical protein
MNEMPTVEVNSYWKNKAHSNILYRISGLGWSDNEPVLILKSWKNIGGGTYSYVTLWSISDLLERCDRVPIEVVKEKGYLTP